jgi:hypothetical protein
MKTMKTQTSQMKTIMEEGQNEEEIMRMEMNS